MPVLNRLRPVGNIQQVKSGSGFTYADFMPGAGIRWRVLEDKVAGGRQDALPHGCNDLWYARGGWLKAQKGALPLVVHCLQIGD